ncbi:uncharacterized protein LOC141856799 [Brevipalpus obovatus]|uniref:uncharacterized protein LOC141856799 n=1 Tax=Brevipalpus obovatus TaxID=246614 RepID=UPI003D9EA036
MKSVILCFTIFLCILPLLISGQQQSRKAKGDVTKSQNITTGNFSAPTTTTSAPLNSPLSAIGSPGSAIISNIGTMVRESVTRAFGVVGQYFGDYSKTFNQLWSQSVDSGLLRSPVVMSAVGISLLGLFSLASLYIFPEIQQITDKQQLKKIGRIGRSIGEMALNMDRAIDTYSTIEPEVCAMMALCTLGSAHKNLKQQSRTIETINTVLNFPGLDEIVLVRKDFRDSHAFGRGGGNCELINIEGKCPFNSGTWKLLLSSLNSVV